MSLLHYDKTLEEGLDRETPENADPAVTRESGKPRKKPSAREQAKDSKSTD